MKTTETPPEPCASCGKVTDAASHLTTDAVPEPGDLSICLYCGHLTMFDENLRHRPLTLKELGEATCDPRVLEIQRARSRT